MRLKLCKPCGIMHDVANWPHAAEDMRAEPAALEHDEFEMGPRTGTFRKCGACGGRHSIDAWPHNCWIEPPQRSELPAPYIISDNLEVIGGLNGVQNQADGKFYTSKARLRADYRARGMIEMGNDKAPAFKKPRPNKKEIRESVERAMSAVVNDGARVENYRKQRKTKALMGRIQT